MKWFHSDKHELHNPELEVWVGTPLPGTEVASRARAIARFLDGDVDFSRGVVSEHGTELLTVIHDLAMVDWLENAWQECRPFSETREIFPDTFFHPQMMMDAGASRAPMSSPLGRLGFYSFDTMTPLVEGTYEAARAAVDVGLSALDAVMSGERAAYALCRPPGHHASSAMIGGFCFFNNAAVVTEAMVRRLGGPVAVIDVDYHHGNGTQSIFYERDDVFYVSLHADPERAYPYFTGHASEIGRESGAGWTQNFPLGIGCSDEQYLAVLAEAVERARDKGVVGVVVSLGVDSYGLDPLSDFALTREVYHPMGAAVAELHLPTVVVQEGGYDTEDLGLNVQSFLRGVAGYEARDVSGAREASTLPQRHV